MLVKYILKKWPLLIVFLVVMIVSPLVQVQSGYASGSMLDYAADGDYQMFVNKLLEFLGYFVLSGALLFVNHTLRIKIASLCRKDLKQDMFRQIMSSNNAFFAKPDAGFHIAAFTNDITILESKYFEAWIIIVDSIVTVATVGVAVFSLNTIMAVIIILGEAFSIGLCYLIRGYSRKKNKIYIEKLAAFTQRIKDYFASFQMIQNYSLESQIKQRFYGMNSETEQSKDDADQSIAFSERLANMCNSLIKFVIVGYGISLVMRGEMTMGLIFTAYQFTDKLVGPMNSIMNNINAIGSVNSIAKRINGIAKASAKEKEQEDIELDQPVTLSLNNVETSIDGKQILKGITYQFEPGKKYLIIGRNGAGKSTLLQLLKRSTEDFGGSITINDRDVRTFSYKSLSSIVSYINEAVPLVCDTVRQNIVLYRDIPEEKVQEAVDTVGLKVSLDRVIRDGDRNLSSGETRRIEIARSLINRSSVIIYDEAISTLDIPTAYQIEKTLLSLKDQTVLFVSHNFSSQLINQYDQIILLDQGEICGYGTHKQLMETSEYYRHIMEIKNG